MRFASESQSEKPLCLQHQAKPFAMFVFQEMLDVRNVMHRGGEITAITSHLVGDRSERALLGFAPAQG